MKQFIKKMPLIGTIAVSIKNKLYPPYEFTTSEDYWINRYKKGGSSGAGSYNKLAEFKGDVINEFVVKQKIETVIDLGCGDGNQLTYFEFPSYIGFDISHFIISKCRQQFKQDDSKQFFHLSELSSHSADLIVSLDVIYHLIEDATYYHYMHQLFDRAILYVIIYAHDNDDSGDFAPHIKPRKFTNWIKENKQEFQLMDHISNKYPYIKGKDSTTSFADFYIYKRNQ